MLSILLIDDHFIMRAVLRQVISEGYPDVQIAEAESVEEAFKKLEQEKFQIVLCDLSMQNQNGFDILEHIKVHFPLLPVIIVSMHDDEKYIRKAMQSGAAAYIRKDQASEFLNTTIARILSLKI